MPPEVEAEHLLGIHVIGCTFIAAMLLIFLAVTGAMRILSGLRTLMSARADTSAVDDGDEDEDEADLKAWQAECADLRPLVRKLGRKPLAREEP